jgi:protein SCO1/2
VRRLLIVWLLCASAATSSADIQGAGWQPRRGATLPLDLAFRDDADREVRLGDFFGAAPVVLVFGYFRCRGLCPEIYRGAREALTPLAIAGKDFRLISVSIDPRDTAADARERRATLGPALLPRAHFLTAQGSSAQRLARAAGFDYRFVAAAGEYAHPAGLVIAGADGAIRDYLPGARFDRARLATLLLPRAPAERGASAAPAVSQLPLVCFHFDPATGRYTLAIARLLALACSITAVALAFWLWRERRRARA